MSRRGKVQFLFVKQNLLKMQHSTCNIRVVVAAYLLLFVWRLNVEKVCEPCIFQKMYFEGSSRKLKTTT